MEILDQIINRKISRRTAIVAGVAGGIATADMLSGGLINTLYDAFVPKPVYAQETDVLEIPYDINPIPEFQTNTAETIPSFYDESRWKNVPSVTWNYQQVYKQVDKLPQMSWRYDDRWLEVFLDLPSFTDKTRLKDHFCWFIFDTLSNRNENTGAPGVYNFKAHFTADEKLIFGELYGGKTLGTFFEPGDYRYRWSFGPTNNSSESHVAYNILFDKKKLTEHSSTMLLEASANDSSNAYHIGNPQDAFRKIYFSDTIKVPEFSNQLIPWVITGAALLIGKALMNKPKMTAERTHK